MKYPNGKQDKSVSNIKISAAHRGMSLEDDINKTNQYYLDEDLAIIHKKPTPVTIVKVDYPSRSSAKITEAYFKLPSTTDYNGIYMGKYLDFEAKECRSSTSFPFASIHPHQIKHLEDVVRHGAIAFIILRMEVYNKCYLIKAEEFVDYYKNCDRKSLPYSWIKENGHEIGFSLLKPCDYLKVVDQIFNLR